MQGISAAPLTATPESQGDTESLEDPAKRAMITPDRVMMLTITLIDEKMITDHGIILESTSKAGFRNGSACHFKELVNYFNGLAPSQKPQCLHWVKLGTEGLKGWVLAIKNLAKTEQECQEHERAIGRPQPPPPAHASAAWALMNQFHIFSDTRQKTNCYTGKPKGLEHIELEKTDDPCIAEIAGGGAKDL